MALHDYELKKLQEEAAKKAGLELRIRELNRQKEELTVRARQLEWIKSKEQSDVDRLEGHSLAAFFYGVIGKMDEKLNKEREEAYAAKVKYDTAAYELTAVSEELEQCQAQLRRLKSCEQRYEEMLKEKSREMKRAAGLPGKEILKLEEQETYLESQKREVQEAIRAGREALDTSDAILLSLGSAENWGTWDLIGGGLMTDMIKHSKLDEAQNQVTTLQETLRRFKTELADIEIQADLQVGVDGFMRFADVFFDGLFVDWAVMNKISNSKSQVQDTKAQIERVLNHLHSLDRKIQAELEGTRQKRKDLIINA